MTGASSASSSGAPQDRSHALQVAPGFQAEASSPTTTTALLDPCPSFLDDDDIPRAPRAPQAASASSSGSGPARGHQDLHQAPAAPPQIRVQKNATIHEGHEVIDDALTSGETESTGHCIMPTTIDNLRCEILISPPGSLWSKCSSVAEAFNDYEVTSPQEELHPASGRDAWRDFQTQRGEEIDRYRKIFRFGSTINCI